jgi:hypothetical protein
MGSPVRLRRGGDLTVTFGALEADSAYSRLARRTAEDDQHGLEATANEPRAGSSPNSGTHDTAH